MKLVLIAAAFGVGAFLASAALTNTKMGVTERHISLAQELCKPNGNINTINAASRKARWVSCGFRCSKATGEQMFEVDVSCRNGATINHAWIE